MVEPESPIEAHLRQIKWLLGGILACLVLVVLALLPALVQIALYLLAWSILIAAAAGLIYGVWWLLRGRRRETFDAP